MNQIYRQCKNLRFSLLVFYTIWYRLYNLKNVKNTHGGVSLLKPATLLKVTLLHGRFSRFLDCTNGTTSHNVSHIVLQKPYHIH